MMWAESKSRAAFTCCCSSSDTLSGQNACPGNFRSETNISATTAGEPGEFGYRGWPTIRSTPFSVSGQVAQACCPLEANHSCALSC